MSRKNSSESSRGLLAASHDLQPVLCYCSPVLLDYCVYWIFFFIFSFLPLNQGFDKGRSRRPKKVDSGGFQFNVRFSRDVAFSFRDPQIFLVLLYRRSKIYDTLLCSIVTPVYNFFSTSAPRPTPFLQGKRSPPKSIHKDHARELDWFLALGTW